MIPTSLLTYVVFTVAIIALLAVDLGLFQRRSHEVKIKEALAWSAVWISLTILFNWVLCLFGLFLVFIGIKMGVQDEEAEVRPERNIFVRSFKKESNARNPRVSRVEVLR